MDLTTYQLSMLSVGAMASGLWLLVRGGAWTIDSARYIAASAGLSPLFIGATIVSFGTSVPELVTSVIANLSGYPGISLGNIVGSNIANVLLVLGATAVLVKVAAARGELLKDLAMMLLATAILAGGMMAGRFGFWAGAGMFVLLVGFVAGQYRSNRLPITDAEPPEAHGIGSVGTAVLVLLGGLGVLAIGSEMLINGAVVLGRVLGVPEAIVGLTAIALGTSLPELSTCIAAARRRESGLILGNIVGSNTFNILSIVGITAVIKPLPVDPALVGVALWFMVGVSLAFAAWMLTVGRITRPTGILMLAGYAAFVILQYQGSKLF